MVSTTNLHLVPRLKKEQSYTCTPSLYIHGRLQGELYLYINDPDGKSNTYRGLVIVTATGDWLDFPLQPDLHKVQHSAN